MRRATVRIMVAALVVWLSSCDQENQQESDDGEYETFLGADGKSDTGDVEAGSVHACGVLEVANTATFEQLDDPTPNGAGLNRLAAWNIVTHRDGADGEPGTEDDDLFDDLAELDVISFVGLAAFEQLLAYATENGYVESCITEAEGRWAFFAVGDSRSHPEVFEAISAGMVKMDPTAVAVFNTGDITSHGTVEQWNEHLDTLAAGAPDPRVPEDPLGIVRQSRIRTDVAEFGPWLRYIGVLGNHDDNNGEWFGNWNTYLPGQRNLGTNGLEGIYFTLTYQNALFIVLDSVNPSEEQTLWLEEVLAGPAQEATWVFPFFHHPVYPCNDKDPWSEGLDWVDLFEQYNIDLVFVAHSHTYERTCPMIGGHCAEGGVRYLNSSAAGAPVRAVRARHVATASFNGRTDEYDCSEVLEVGRGYWDHFCHVVVNDCRLEVNCYDHDWGDAGGDPYDSLEIDHCE